jgi:hypothetical protein
MKPTLVDLRMFATGREKAVSVGKLWNGRFSGRPKLIAEMAPAIKSHLLPLAEKSIAQFMNALRAWWRLLDAVEAALPHETSLTSTAQFTELHRQRALDQGMDRLIYGNFLLLVNKTRAGLGLKPLFWPRPEQMVRSRHLPPQWQTDLIRHELKHRWFGIVDRWNLASTLLQRGAPLVARDSDPELFDEQQRLLKSYQRLEQAMQNSRKARPAQEDIWGTESRDDFYKEHTVMEALRGRYPDHDDIRVAFLLCLATTGWNPAVFLSLNVEEPFIETHPKDSKRYILRGVKDRGGGTEQVTEGLFKSQGGAGFMLRLLMEQTLPLRHQLQQELKRNRETLESGLSSAEERIELQQRITALERGARSPWLYVSANRGGLHWLADDNYNRRDYLSIVVDDLNRRQPSDRQLARITPGDLRDAYAARIYHSSGGSILTVMKALNHKRLGTTGDYLDNTLLKEEHAKLYTTYSEALWHEIKIHRRIDPSIIAKWSRDGSVSTEQRERLHTYRELLRSRIGVGCKDPLNPPKRLAPNFIADGQTHCPVQRCLLCTEHAVVFPDSLPGICKRLAELRYLKANMSISAFLQSSFATEMENAELVLQGFDPSEVERHLLDWEGRIAQGSHRVVEFDGQEV